MNQLTDDTLKEMLEHVIVSLAITGIHLEEEDDDDDDDEAKREGGREEKKKWEWMDLGECPTDTKGLVDVMEGRKQKRWRDDREEQEEEEEEEKDEKEEEEKGKRETQQEEKKTKRRKERKNTKQDKVREINSEEENDANDDKEKTNNGEEAEEWQKFVLGQILILLQHFGRIGFDEENKKSKKRMASRRRTGRKRTMKKSGKDVQDALSTIGEKNLVPAFFVTDDGIISAALNLFILTLLELQQMGYIHGGRTRKNGHPMITKGEDWEELWLVSANEIRESVRQKAKQSNQEKMKKGTDSRGTKKIEGFGRRKMKQMHSEGS